VSGAAEETLDDELGQQALGQGDSLPGNGERGDGGGAVDEDLRLSCQLLRSADSSRLARGGASETYALVVDDLDDVARPPAKGWSPLMRTTRPTSTRRQLDPSITASPIVTVVCRGFYVSRGSSRELCGRVERMFSYQ